jgi:hypothetical protein
MKRFLEALWYDFAPAVATIVIVAFFLFGSVAR